MLLCFFSQSNETYSINFQFTCSFLSIRSPGLNSEGSQFLTNLRYQVQVIAENIRHGHFYFVWLTDLTIQKSYKDNHSERLKCNPENDALWRNFYQSINLSWQYLLDEDGAGGGVFHQWPKFRKVSLSVYLIADNGVVLESWYFIIDNIATREGIMGIH